MRGGGWGVKTASLQGQQEPTESQVNFCLNFLTKETYIPRQHISEVGPEKTGIHDEFLSQPYLPHTISGLGFSCMTMRGFQNEILNNFLVSFCVLTSAKDPLYILGPERFGPHE